jgi:RNA polymerase sigma factor (sigma-70 family)
MREWHAPLPHTCDYHLSEASFTLMKSLCDAPCLSLVPGARCNGGRCLVERARSGEQNARELMFSKLYGPVLRQARMLCRMPSDAEDLTQNALLRVFERLAQLREPARLLAWTRRIVQNTHRMSMRRSKFDPGANVELRESAIGYSDAPADGPTEHLGAQENCMVLFEKIRELPPRLKWVLESRVFQGKTTLETAKALEISEEAVRTRLVRARKTLRRHLNEHPSRRGMPLAPISQGRELDRAIREAAATHGFRLLAIHRLPCLVAENGAAALRDYCVYELIDPVRTRHLLNGGGAYVPLSIHRVDIAQAADGWRLYVHRASEPARVLAAGKPGEESSCVERAFRMIQKRKDG